MGLGGLSAALIWGTGAEVWAPDLTLEMANPRATPLARDQLDKAGQPGGPVYAIDYPARLKPAGGTGG